MATTMMSPLEERLRVEVAAELEKSIKARLEAEYAAQLASMQEAERTRFEDKLAKYQKDCERDFDGRLEAASEKLWQTRKADYVERMQDTREALEGSQGQATLLAESLRALATAIWPELDRFKAVGRHLAITELDVVALAPGLQALGMRLAAKVTDSEHMVALLMPPSGVQMVNLLALKTHLPLTTDNRVGEVRIDGPAQ